MGALTDRAKEIKEETRIGKNTAARLGGVLVEMAKLIESSGNPLKVVTLPNEDAYNLIVNKDSNTLYVWE